MNRKKTRKQLSAAKKYILQITASALLFIFVVCSKNYMPNVYERIKSNLTYTPDLSFAINAAKNFILKYTPR